MYNINIVVFLVYYKCKIDFVQVEIMLYCIISNPIIVYHIHYMQYVDGFITIYYHIHIKSYYRILMDYIIIVLICINSDFITYICIINIYERNLNRWRFLHLLPSPSNSFITAFRHLAMKLSKIVFFPGKNRWGITLPETNMAPTRKPFQ